MIRALALFALVGSASSHCANDCSGHGDCGESDKCLCSPGWTKVMDCSQRTWFPCARQEGGGVLEMRCQPATTLGTVSPPCSTPLHPAPTRPCAPRLRHTSLLPACANPNSPHRALAPQNASLIRRARHPLSPKASAPSPTPGSTRRRKPSPRITTPSALTGAPARTARASATTGSRGLRASAPRAAAKATPPTIARGTARACSWRS